MRIPELYLTILQRNLRLINDNSDIRTFVNTCFRDLFVALPNLSFQARAKKSGDMFEYLFYYLMREKFNIDFESDIPIKEACMLNGGELDFGIIRKGKILCGIEAKGSAENIGDSPLLRPALKRTDTVKKAISQAYQFKRIFPTTPFFIVTNVKPLSGNAACMLDLAEGDIIDKVVDVTNPSDLKDFIKRISAIKQHS